jgi:hypothetical protein
MTLDSALSAAVSGAADAAAPSVLVKLSPAVCNPDTGFVACQLLTSICAAVTSELQA